LISFSRVIALVNVTELLEVNQPVHVVSGRERAALAFFVLQDAAFESLP